MNERIAVAAPDTPVNAAVVRGGTMLKKNPTIHGDRSRLRSGMLWLSLAGLLVPTLAAAQPPVVVTNDAEPASGLQVPQLEELWRRGGEDDDIFFGNVGGGHLDADGNVLLLDSQLSQVYVIGTDGEILRIIGREGDGPGEVRRPAGFFVADDGTVCLLQGFPGRIVKLTPDGLPAGDTTYAAGDGQGQFAVLNAGFADKAGMVLLGIRMSFGGAVSQQTYFLDRCDAEGKRLHNFLEKEHAINYAQFELDEGHADFVWSRTAVDGAGHVVTAPERNVYAIQVYDAEGRHTLTFSRPYETLTRNEEQRKIARQIFEGVGAFYPTPPVKITIENTEPDIAGLQITNDGRIWVQTSRGLRDKTADTWQTLDVFTSDGKFERQVALAGNHDGSHDGLTILPDGRILVIVGLLDAFLTQQGVSSEESTGDGEEASPLEVICYRMDLN